MGDKTIRIISVFLCGLMIGVSGPTHAASQPSFAQVLKKYRIQLDRAEGTREQIIQSFAQELIDRNIGITEVDAYVQKQLTEKEYRAYKKDLEVSLVGLNPEKLSPEEFSQVLYRALTETQAKGLTWSSCDTRTVGILIAVASVIVGIIALTKEKLDRITEQALLNHYLGQKSQIESQYRDTDSKLRNPQGYFDNKINNARNSINSKRRDVDYYRGRIDEARKEMRQIQYQLTWGNNTEEEEDYLRRRLVRITEDIDNYQDRVDDFLREIGRLQDQITHYLGEKIRYQDPAVIQAERDQLEVWYPKALSDVEENYKIKLAQLPAVNAEIDSKNKGIVNSRKTLGIIAGVGGAASLAIILTNKGSCR